ncbi:DUF4175 family protein [Mucilaginibacter sp.]
MPVANNYNFLIAQINRFIRRYELNRLLRGLIFLGAGLFSAYLIITLTEYLGNFNTALRTGLFYLFITVNVLLICWLVLPPLLSYLRLRHTLTHEEAAEIIGRHFTDVQDKLLNTLQLQQLAGQDTSQRQLIEASIHQKIETLKPVNFPSAINFKANTKYMPWLAYPLAIIVLIALIAPAVLKESTKRIIRHNEYFAPVAPFQFIILNTNLKVTQGDDLKLNIRLKGNRLPDEVYIEMAGQSFRLNKNNISRFNYLFTNVQQNTRFRLTGNGYNSAFYEVKVAYKPVLLHLNAQISYPAYLHRKAEQVQNAGDLTVPVGSTVEWQLTTNNAESVTIKANGKATQAKSIGGNRFEYTLRAVHSLTYTLIPQNNEAAHSDSISYKITTIADELPAINVLQQRDSVSLKSLYFSGSIADDHGFSALNFCSVVAIPSDKKRIKVYKKRINANISTKNASFFYYLNTAQLPANSGSTVSYYFEVADNDAVNGPKYARSQEFTLQIPGAQETDRQLNAGSQAVKQQLQSAIKIAGQLERETQQANQMLFNKSSLSYDEKKQLESLIQKRNDLNELLKNIRQESKNNTYNRQENQQQTAELTAKQKEMEQLMNQLLDTKTQDMLKQLENLLQRNQKEATRNELSDLQSDNQSLKKDLNRMLELYKKLDFDQKLNQSVNQLQEMAKQQQQLADKTSSKNANTQQLQQEQQQLRQNFDKVKEGLNELQKTSEQLEQKTGYQNPGQQSIQVDQQMSKSAAQLEKNNKGSAQQAQQQAAAQLRQMANQLQQQEQEGEEQQNQLNLQQLRELVKNLVNSSFNQEKLLQRLRGTSSNDPAYITLAQTQKDIKDNIKTAQDSLYALSRRVPQIQSAVNQEIRNMNSHIDGALALMDERRTPEAVRLQQQAMTAMNNLALMLSEVIDQVQRMMKNAKPGSGKKQGSLSQLSQQQQQLNQNMQRMREQMQQQGNQGKSAPSGQSEQLARMARQQQMIRQALEKYSREQADPGSAGAGSLNKIAKAMEQTESDIVNKNLTNESLIRQQQIHTRLLEADKAEQQREQDKQRESNAGTRLPPGYIKALQNYQQQRAKQTEQLQTVPPALNLYFKQRVKNYFDQLNAQ